MVYARAPLGNQSSKSHVIPFAPSVVDHDFTCLRDTHVDNGGTRCCVTGTIDSTAGWRGVTIRAATVNILGMV
jgi:hypothetical protein